MNWALPAPSPNTTRWPSPNTCIRKPVVSNARISSRASASWVMAPGRIVSPLRGRIANTVRISCGLNAGMEESFKFISVAGPSMFSITLVCDRLACASRWICGSMRRRRGKSINPSEMRNRAPMYSTLPRVRSILPVMRGSCSEPPKWSPPPSQISYREGE